MWLIFLGSTLPWLTGGLAVGLVFAPAMQKTGYLTLLIGVGGLFGTIGIALLTILATWMSTNLTTLWAITVLGLCCSACAMRIHRLRAMYRAYPEATKSNFGVIELAAFALIILIAGINIWQVIWVPPAGWDTLWSWAEISKNFIETTQASPIRSWVHDETHPSTVAVISAMAATYIPSAGGIGPNYFSWWLVWLSILLIIYGYTKAVTKNTTTSALSALVSASIPLLTNHVILGGYAEIFLAATVAGATAMLTLSLKERDKKLALLGLLLALSCISLKNIGFVFCGCILFGYVSCLLVDRGFGKWLIIVVAITILCFCLFLLTYNAQSLSFELGNRQLMLVLGNAPSIIRNELVSLFYNASFSTTTLLLIAPIMILGTVKWNQGNTNAASCFLPWLINLTLLAVICASQLTDYGFLYAVPGNDTGNSRLSLPLIVSTLLLIGPMWCSVTRD